MLDEYLFHLRRAFGQSNRPPPNADNTFGKVLTYRINRYIGISREGIVSLSWPINEDEEYTSNECLTRHLHFQGIYLLLHLHVFGEKVTLIFFFLINFFKAYFQRVGRFVGSTS